MGLRNQKMGFFFIFFIFCYLSPVGRRVTKTKLRPRVSATVTSKKEPTVAAAIATIVGAQTPSIKEDRVAAVAKRRSLTPTGSGRGESKKPRRIWALFDNVKSGEDFDF
jgi:hypothetical protein